MVSNTAAHNTPADDNNLSLIFHNRFPYNFKAPILEAKDYTIAVKKLNKSLNSSYLMAK
jgi:hypothetical protein